ncbi:hypothetical protein [Sphingosinicella humi]|nr:hypothetical protein [Sphingosinicella humi]
MMMPVTFQFASDRTAAARVDACAIAAITLIITTTTTRSRGGCG